MIDQIGFSDPEDPRVKSINYFGGWDPAVPNNNTLLIGMANASEFKAIPRTPRSGRQRLAMVQLDTAELPYLIHTKGEPDRTHFLCHQYNAFEFVYLAHYLGLSGDQAIYPVLERPIAYLARDLDETDWARYDCNVHHIDVPYYTYALGHAFRVATELDLGDNGSHADRCLGNVLDLQRGDGSFPYFSRGNYLASLTAGSIPAISP